MLKKLAILTFNIGFARISLLSTKILFTVSLEKCADKANFSLEKCVSNLKYSLLKCDLMTCNSIVSPCYFLAILTFNIRIKKKLPCFFRSLSCNSDF